MTEQRMASMNKATPRPFPDDLPYYVQSIGMCSKDWRCNGTACTYAHSRKELSVWNKELLKENSRKRYMSPEIIQQGGKKAKLGEPSESAASTSENIDEPDSPDSIVETTDQKSCSPQFVTTEIYRKLKSHIEMMNIYGHKGLYILGTKGNGKSRALLELSNEKDGVYIDLALSLPTTTRPSSCLLLDNAQLFSKRKHGTLIEEHKIIIAAFSPGATLRKSVKALSKTCGDGKGMKFYWRPFTYYETRELCLSFDNKLKKKQISSIHQCCAGNPRYIIFHILTKNTSSSNPDALMQQELGDQFGSIISKDTCDAMNMSSEDICKAIIADFTHKKTYPLTSFHPTASLGCSYNTQSDGTGTWKVANSYFVCSAIVQTGGPDFLFGERWQQLETLTTLVFHCTSVTVKGAREVMELPKSNTVIFQEEIGEVITPAKNSVTMVKLTSGHNLIDSILYDRRGKPAKIYFLQTSMSSYSGHKKGLKCVPTTPVKNGSIVVTKQSTRQHYSNCITGEKEYFYLYVTTAMPKQKRSYPEDIYFLDLVKYFPF